MPRRSQTIAFAAIWEHNSDAGDAVSTLTTEPNAEASGVHDRMPVILRRTEWRRWFSPEPLMAEERLRMLVPTPDGALAIWPVDHAASNVRNDNSSLIEPDWDELKF